MRKQQSGFTLIELIIVIVILGVLSAFAVPRFANLGGDARRAVVESAEGSMRSASAIVHSAYLAAGTNPATVNLEGVNIGIVNGYPNAADIAAAAGLATTDFTITPAAPTSTIQVIGATTPAQCQVVYTQAAAANTSPTFVITATGC
jgi:MSHA pilin protein MshA